MEINKNKLVLGTVQFGLDYGINNKKGKPSKHESLEMLKKAYENGINIFDTASAYGEAEEILGEFISKNNLYENVLIISKLSPNLLENSKGDILEIIESEIKKSLEKLKVKSLYGYLLHTPEYIYNKEIVSALKSCKEKGLIQNLGVSVYEEKDAIYAATLPVDFIQIPYSIFDQRLDKTDFFNITKKNNIKVFARSAFLQGLVFMDEEEIPDSLNEAKQYIKNLNEITKKYNLTTVQAALLFSYKNPNIDYVVFGVDNIGQLKEDIKIVEENMNCEKCIEELKNKFIDVPKSIIFPSLWKKQEKLGEKKKVLAIIQARMGSSRLPGKMLKQINGKPLIWYVINAAKKSKLINEVVLATTDKEEDKALIEKAKEYGIPSFAGSENDVLDRFYQASKEFKGATVVRLTGDCPLHDPEVIDKVIQNFIENKADYTSNFWSTTFPDGLDVEVFSFKVLEEVWKKAKLKSEREHVTPYIYRNNPDLFKITNLEYTEDLSSMRWAVDEQKDLDFVSEIIKNLNGKEVNLINVLKVLGQSSELGDINKMYNRNEGYLTSLERDKINNFSKSLELLKKAKEIIPTASQTYSKSSKYFVEGAAPAFLERGKAGHVWDVDGNEYIDFVCALGSVTIGYNNEKINQSIINELQKGISFTFPTELEIKLAEKLIKIVPCAEMIKFVKNGSDATTAAVRLARAYTKKDIIACCGYHGYHDWYVGTTDNDLGVPQAVKQLTKTFEYNKIESLKKLFEENKGQVAGVILEPCQENGPKDNFLEKVRQLTHENNAVLIFDEVVSGFRISLGGAQEYYNVLPDLSSLGKGMGNGASISALAGKKEIMKLIDEGVFISTTFGGETIGLAAALTTIELLEKKENFEHILSLGNKWIQEVTDLINEKQLNDVVSIYGISPHCGVIFNRKGNLTNHELFSVYQQTLIENEILSLGINNFCLEHTREDVDKFISAVNLAFDKIKEAIEKNSVKEILKGKKFQPIFKR